MAANDRWLTGWALLCHEEHEVRVDRVQDLQQSIKRDLIMKLKDQFKDSRAPLVGSWECWLVSTSRFDEDAVAHAKAHGVRCYQAVGAGERGMALHEVRATTGDV